MTLHMQQLEAPLMTEEDDQDKLMMWKYCTTCETITNIVPVSDYTWSLSFSMFLHLLLHENKLVRRGASRPDAVCSHSLHQQHLTCFGKGSLVATFKYSKLNVYNVDTPGDHVDIPDVSYNKDILTQRLRRCKEASSTVYSSILTKLHNNTDSGYETDHDEEHRSYRDRLEKLEESINNDSGDGRETMSLLNLFQRDIMLSHLFWTRKLTMLPETLKNNKRITSVAVSDSVDTKVNLQNSISFKRFLFRIVSETTRN